MTLIRSFFPSIEPQDREAVCDAVDNGWGDSRDSYIKKLEYHLRIICNHEFSLALSHGSDALHLALASLDLKPGDEVIVPDLTWVACVSPIIHLGLKPVLVNVDESLCLNPASLKSALSSRTKALIAVDLAGSLPEWDELKLIARERGIKVIEDAAESLGGYYKGKPAGSFGDISILSFAGTKVVTGGQGGAVLTSDPGLFKRMKLLSHHGINQSETGKYYWSTVAGYNFQLSNIQAALIYSQLQRLDDLVMKKKILFESYKRNLQNFSALKLIESPLNVKPSHWLIVGVIANNLGLLKEDVIRVAQKFEVDIRPFFYLISDMPPFANCRVAKDPQRMFTEELSKYGICLPYGYDMTEEKVKKVVDVLKEIIK